MISRTSILLLAFVACVAGEVYFKETFDADWEKRWVASSAKGSDHGKYELSAGKFHGDATEDVGLKTMEDYRFYDLSAKMDKVFDNDGKTLVVQYSVKHEQKIDCGGGYIKIFPEGLDQEKMDGDSTYNIMFGPDICGTSTRKTHVIFGYKGKNLLTKKDIRCETDELTHLYTLIVRPDKTYEVLIDNKKVDGGDLTEDFDFLKPKQIRDPSEKKPEDWVDNAEIDDPEDKKPEGYDDIPKEIADPDAKKPDDWDEESDGEWEAPMISNPEYKGVWKAKKIPNPEYKGKWEAKLIDNPDFEDDPELHIQRKMAYIGFELWQVKAGTIFDNIIVTDDVEEAKKFAEATTLKNQPAEKKLKQEADDAERKKMEEERKAREEEAAKKKAEEGDDDDDDDDDEDDDDDKERKAKVDAMKAEL
jgi:calreticulin